MARLPHRSAVARAAALLAGTLVLGACGSNDAQKAAQVRLPVAPDERSIAPGPAVLDTIQPFVAPTGLSQADWQLAATNVAGGWHVRYRAPVRWQVEKRGRSHSLDGLVRVQVEPTQVRDDQLSLAAYAATLAEGEPIYRLGSAGVPAYLTARRVSAAPSDPVIEAAWFHTAVLDLGGRIVKVECRYDASDRFRFYDVCMGVLGTIQAGRTT
jgi:hypothetical protein